LTDDDLQMVRGKRDQLVGKIQERYGIAKDEAERQVDDFSRTYDTDETSTREKIRTAGRSSSNHRQHGAIQKPGRSMPRLLFFSEDFYRKLSIG